MLRRPGLSVVRNKTARPIRIPLAGGKTLHLGPSQIAQIADKATERPEMQKLVEDGLIEILGEGERVSGIKDSGGGQKQSRAGIKSFRRGQGDR